MATARNPQRVTFGLPATANWPSPPTHASVWHRGTLIGIRALGTPPARVDETYVVVIEPQQLVLTLPRGQMTDAWAALALSATAVVEVRLHSGNPGANGTANQISGNGYAHAHAVLQVSE